MSRERKKIDNRNNSNNANTQFFPIVYWLINILLVGAVSAGIYFAIDFMPDFTLAMLISLALVVIGIVFHILLSLAQKQYSNKPFKDKQAGILFTNLFVFVIVLLIGSIISYTFVTNKYLDYDKIYEGVFVDECDLSNLTYEEAREIILNYDKDKMAGISQSITVDGTQTIYTSDDLGIYSDADEVLSEAYNYGRVSSKYNRIAEIFALKSEPKVFNITYTQNEDYIDFIAQNIVNTYTKQAVDASFEFNAEAEGGFSYISDQVGAVIDKDEIIQALKNNMDSMAFSDLNFTTEAVEPNVLLADIQNQTTLIATCTTELEDDPDRTSNVDLASFTIEGIVQAGETFSFNSTTGERTISGGYKVAHAIADGSELIDSVAGGVCQVASTLYSALLDTDIEIVERHNHSFTVSYLPPGRDATVDFNTEKDFKFTNNTGAPLYITSYVTDNEPDEYGDTLNTLTINIYGTAPDPTKLVAARVEVISSTSGGWETSFSDNVKTGETVIEKNKINGKETETYRDYYENGVLVESVLVSQDVYKSVTGKKIYGRG